MTITDIFPVSYQGSGTVRVQFWKTAVAPAAPTLAEMTAATALDATCYFRADGFTLTHSQERVDDTRLCDQSARESFGRSTFAVDNFSYIYKPGDASANTPGNLAYATFTPNSTGFLGVRYGTPALLSGAAIAAAQLFDIYAVEFGDRLKNIPVGDNAKHLVTQQVSLTRLAVDYAVPAA